MARFDERNNVTQHGSPSNDGNIKPYACTYIKNFAYSVKGVNVMVTALSDLGHFSSKVLLY
jgi:hypothetical protein